MRVNNSFSPNYPIIAGNNDFVSIVPCNDLSQAEFKLVDANLQEIHLLTPLYLTIRVEGIEFNQNVNIYIKDEELKNQ